MNIIDARNFQLFFNAGSISPFGSLANNMNTESDSSSEMEPPKMVPMRVKQDRVWEAEKIRLDFVKSQRIDVPPKGAKRGANSKDEKDE